MTYRVVRSPRAVEDLEAIKHTSLADSAAYTSVVKKILTTTSGFSRFPLSGRIVLELGDGSIREWFACSYRVIYQVEDEMVMVTALVHGRRLLEFE